MSVTVGMNEVKNPQTVHLEATIQLWVVDGGHHVASAHASWRMPIHTHTYVHFVNSTYQCFGTAVRQECHPAHANHCHILSVAVLKL